jgi:hypothetical protein
MCPFCLGTLGLVVAGTVSTGGLAALAVRVSRKKKHVAETISNDERSSENANPNSR